MKLLILLFSITFAYSSDYEEVVIETENAVYAYDINCILPQGVESRIFTELDRVHLDSAEMKHRKAKVKGCDSEAIGKLVVDSNLRFGHVVARVQLVKRTYNNSRVVFGKCQRNYSEKVLLYFDHGLTLKTPAIGKLIPADDC